MKKLIPLLFGLMLPLTGAFADDFTDQAVEFCRSKGGNYSMGSMVEEGSKYCRQVTCKKTNSDRYEIPDGAPGPEANVEATKRVCVDKSVVDGSFNTAGATNGAQSGSQSGSQSGAQSGSQSGSQSGAQSGAQSGSAGGDDAFFCEELEGNVRLAKRCDPNDPTCQTLCYKECKPRRSFLGIIGAKKEGFERKSCVECLLKYPGVFKVKKEYLPTDKNGKVIGDNSVSLGKGVTAKTGVIVCKDSRGNVVTVTGSACPSGSVVYSGSTAGSGNGTIVVSGNGRAAVGSGSGAGTIIVSGSAGAGGTIQRPAYCDSDKSKDLKRCEEWMRVNQRFLCASGGNPALCMGDGYGEIMSRYDASNCVNCQVGGRKQSTLSGIAEIVGAIAPPLAQFGSAYVGARAYQKGQEAWAGAAVAGFEQCQLSQNNYMQYLSANELPGLSPAQQAAMGCNGFQLGGFAGLQNGGLNGWYGAGYSPGFMGGMMGPYGGYDPYGMGMGGYVGGAVGGMMAGGMMQGGYVGGYPGGMMAGGMVNGISIAGGINAGMAGGMMQGGYVGGYAQGGMMQGGYVGGYPGGMMQGGYVGGYAQGGYAQGGYIGGYNAGMAGGMVNGISIAGGINGGYAGGYAGGFNGGYAGGYAGGYMAGGMVGGGYAGGMMPGGYMAGGYAGGYAGGMMAGGYMAGGMAGGNYQASQGSANIDGMLQQQGAAYQMGGMMGGYGSPYGAGGYPMNAGFQIGGQFGMGMGGGMYGGW
jgi:hypothetical protein